MRADAADLLAENPRDDRADERSERDDEKNGWIQLHARQPLRSSISPTLIVARLRNSTTKIARPIADSAAATVRMKNTNTCPDTSPRKRENATKFVLTASSISSIAIKSTITFLRLMKMPATAIQNSTAPSAM